MRRLTFSKLFLCALLCTTGCAAKSSRGDYGGTTWSRSTDDSPSPLSQEQAWSIAKATIAAKEGWPEHKVDSNHLIHTVAYEARRINEGGWRVVAHRAVTEGSPDGGGGCGYDPIPAAVIIINKKGFVSDYFHQ